MGTAKEGEVQSQGVLWAKLRSLDFMTWATGNELIKYETQSILATSGAEAAGRMKDRLWDYCADGGE